MATLKELTEADVLDISARLDEPQWLRDRRQEAFKVFTDCEWPTNRVEEWRYTNPRRFDLDRPIVFGAGAAAAPQGGIISAVADRLAGFIRLVDGGVAAAAVYAEARERGVVVTDLATAATAHEALVREHLGTVVPTDDRFTAASLAAFTTGAFVYVPDDVTLDDPIGISIQVDAGGTVLPRVLVVLGRNARANVYIDHRGDAEATVVEAIEVVAGDGAVAQVVSAQDWGHQGDSGDSGPPASHVSQVAAHRGRVGRDAVYRALEVTIGGRTVYVRPDVALDHPGGSAQLFGLYFGSADQHFEHRSLIHHNASHTASESVFKGALQGASRAAWVGNIRIEPHAKATTSDETNRNLILTDGAYAHSIPFLEILTSDVVQCGHHSSVGQVDELQLFYLESRGIPREEAARLLVFGFFTEVLERIDLPGVTDTVLAEIEQEIRSGPTALMDQRRSR